MEQNRYFSEAPIGIKDQKEGRANLEMMIRLPFGDQRLALTGSAERNLKMIRDHLGVSIVQRHGLLRVSGSERAVRQASFVLDRLTQAVAGHQPVDRQAVMDAIFEAQRRHGDGDNSFPSSSPRRDPNVSHRHLHTENERSTHIRNELDVYLHGKRIRAFSPAQQQYLESIRRYDLTLCVGPAGTGKTYLAVAAAVDMLKRGSVRKLVLVRPAVEAGEKLGFLPGNMQEKVNPYLRPLLDSLHDMMDFEQIQRFMVCDVIEIVPLAFMRGRTLNDALIILDEAQNTTRSQMLMFLTRLGRGSKMVITGDTSQIDLDKPRESGLVDAARRLRRVPGVGMVALNESDIVRHNLVQRIVEVYGQPNTKPHLDVPRDEPPDAPLGVPTDSQPIPDRRTVVVAQTAIQELPTDRLSSVGDHLTDAKRPTTYPAIADDIPNATDSTESSSTLGPPASRDRHDFSNDL